MSLTFSFEIGSAKSSLSLRYLPFENFVTNISILTPLEVVFAFFGQQAEVHRTVGEKYLLCRSAEVNGTKTKSPLWGGERDVEGKKKTRQELALLK